MNLENLGIKVIPSVANFITIIFNKFLESIYVRKPFGEKKYFSKKVKCLQNG